MSSRVYLPSSWSRLREVLSSGRVGPPPLRGHAVTDRLRREHPGGDEEEWEYVAMTAAGLDSVTVLREDDPSRRVVLAVDVDAVTPVPGDEASLVEVADAVPLRRLAAVHVDSADAEQTVASARKAHREAGQEDEVAGALARCLDHELGWYAVQEVAALLEP